MTIASQFACMCISEVTRLQICDIRFDFFTMTEDTSLFGIAAIHICNRKNMGPAAATTLGRFVDPRCDIVTQLRAWAGIMGLIIDPRCTKHINPAARCPFCKPVFLRFDNHELPGAVAITIDQPLSVKMAGGAVKRCMSLHDTPWYPRREISRHFVHTLSSERSRLRAP